MKKLIFLFLFICNCEIQSQIITTDYKVIENTESNTVLTDTLFFDEIYNFYSISPSKFAKLEFTNSWNKNFLPRIMTGRHYFSGVNEINPIYSIWEDKGILSLSDENFLNLDHAGEYTKKDFRKIYFLKNEQSVFFYKYANDFLGKEMRYFAMRVFFEKKWHISANEITENMFVSLENTVVILPHKIYN